MGQELNVRGPDVVDAQSVEQLDAHRVGRLQGLALEPESADVYVGELLLRRVGEAKATRSSSDTRLQGSIPTKGLSGLTDGDDELLGVSDRRAAWSLAPDAQLVSSAARRSVAPAWTPSIQLVGVMSQDVVEASVFAARL